MEAQATDTGASEASPIHLLCGWFDVRFCASGGEWVATARGARRAEAGDLAA